MSLGVNTITRSTVTTVKITSDDIGRNNLGPELQDNWDMSKGVTGWTAGGSTIEAVIDGEYNALKITAIDGSFDQAGLSISGLTIGKMYRLDVIARRGAQGTSQFVRSATWATISQTAITTTTYQNYVFDVAATAVSGLSRVYAALSGAIGDEAFVRQVSIREIL